MSEKGFYLTPGRLRLLRVAAEDPRGAIEPRYALQVGKVVFDRTVAALCDAGLFAPKPRSGWVITEEGRAALARGPQRKPPPPTLPSEEE